MIGNRAPEGWWTSLSQVLALSDETRSLLLLVFRKQIRQFRLHHRAAAFVIIGASLKRRIQGVDSAPSRA